ncbi:hypothetical protein F4861DRAFT_549292 [Xylaria intraflava]|nr:hypothetical protein F4861DRAFT_549292 [Xylaria intraflava]
MDRNKLEVIAAHPFGTHLDAVRVSLNEAIQDPADLDTVGRKVLENLGISLLLALRNHAVSQLLSSPTGHGSLDGDIIKLVLIITSDAIYLDQCKPLLSAVLTHGSDADIWEHETPWRCTSSSIANSSEMRDNFDEVLSRELGVMYVDVPDFYEAFFGNVPHLETTSRAIFEKCTQGPQPLFQQGWIRWPQGEQDSVLRFLAEFVDQLLEWAQDYKPTARRLLAQPDRLLTGSVAQRELHVGFIDDPKSDQAVYDQAVPVHWSRILVPGELKSNPNEDKPSKTGLDIARYVKEVFAAQPTRRFVLAFALCGSWMRLWEFDRLGGIASDTFDINEDGQRFVSIMLGFLWMDDSLLGFDPTIKSDHRQYIEIQRDGKTERLVLDGLIRPARGIVGRATICWKAHPEGDESTPLSLVIKDSWQLTDRDDEGELLQEVAFQDMTNVARYYHYEPACVDIQHNVRKGLDITKASNYPSGPTRNSQHLTVEDTSRNSSAGSKRSSSQTGAHLPPSKRSRSDSTSPIKPSNEPLPNRIFRRIVLRDYGKPIYKASSPAALLSALEGCIDGHEALYKAGILHRDISINNLIINEDDKNPSWSSFLIDLDLAIKVDRIQPSGAQAKTGTRAFMAVGVLYGDSHSFMDDLESFFWVLFWICIHYQGPHQARIVPEFDSWNFRATEEIARQKLGTVAVTRYFQKTVSTHFTPYYECLIPCIMKLRDIVFPDGKTWVREDQSLYSRMRGVLHDSQT